MYFLSNLLFLGSGKRLASCSDDSTVKIWKEYPPGNPEGVATVDNDSAWKCVCTISGQHSRTIYDIDWCPHTGKMLKYKKENKSIIFSILGLIATASGDDAIRIFKEDEGGDPNAPTFSLICQLEKAHNQDVNSIAWNPVSKGMLASCSDDGEIKIWNLIDF